MSGAELPFLTLTLAGQLCGISVLAVRDILAAKPSARVPLAPPEVAGSLNLRGRIVTAIDLRRRLGLPPADADAAPMSVVVEQGGELYALLVDAVEEVIPLRPDAMEPNPPTLKPAWAACAQGVFRLEGRLMVVLSAERLLEIAPPPARAA
ncbi:MAG TPA: chemotaxis protein CheW [Acetobacteraceae bacterium]|nr:chemotaxis protein CheW [Acetobacteraceae bacterium]